MYKDWLKNFCYFRSLNPKETGAVCKCWGVFVFFITARFGEFFSPEQLLVLDR